MKKFSLKSHSTNSSPFWTFFSAIIAVNLMIFLSGCVSLPKSTEKSQKISRAIEGKGLLSSQPIKIFTILRKIPAFPLKTTIKTFLSKADFKDFFCLYSIQIGNFFIRILTSTKTTFKFALKSFLQALLCPKNA